MNGLLTISGVEAISKASSEKTPDSDPRAFGFRVSCASAAFVFLIGRLRAGADGDLRGHVVIWRCEAVLMGCLFAPSGRCVLVCVGDAVGEGGEP